ncbi:hypothetical protein B0T19DRAFT_109297 [Cercophora scortea]|uniref:Uncharacterized protein n=1 Tax=Cercophora scortea TaxID=314031 RepID=A0AAE0IWS0_9PEZI|nr:hypothetical protein B0T19DRAFT_109297 [Cercophora scortea]
MTLAQTASRPTPKTTHPQSTHPSTAIQAAWRKSQQINSEPLRQINLPFPRCQPKKHAQVSVSRYNHGIEPLHRASHDHLKIGSMDRSRTSCSEPGAPHNHHLPRCSECLILDSPSRLLQSVWCQGVDHAVVCFHAACRAVCCVVSANDAIQRYPLLSDQSSLRDQTPLVWMTKPSTFPPPSWQKPSRHAECGLCKLSLNKCLRCNLTLTRRVLNQPLGVIEIPRHLRSPRWPMKRFELLADSGITNCEGDIGLGAAIETSSE